MAFNFCRSSVKVAVAQICRSLGWSAVHTTPLEILVDLMERYVVSLAKNTQKYAEQVGRADASSGDLLLALADVNALLPELLEYMKNVDPIEFPKKVPAFPVPKPCKLIYCDDTDEGDAAELGRDSQNFNPIAESEANGASGAHRKSAAIVSPDKAGQPRPLQELGNDAFRESLRMLLESDDTDIEEKLGKAPDRRPPVQMAQIMRQRRPAPAVQPISITGATSSTPVVTTVDNAGIAEVVPVTVRLSQPEPPAAKSKRDRSSSGTASGPPGDGPPPKRSKTGKTGSSSGGGGSSGKGHDGSAKASTGSTKSTDPKRREKAAVAKQRKRDQNYSALAEALTAAPLQVPQAALASGERRSGSSAPASRSSSKHAAGAAGAADHATPSVVASSSSSSTVQAGQSKGSQRGHAASASLSAERLQHLEDTINTVIRGTDSSRRQDRAAGRAERAVAESDEDEEVDVEDLNHSHDQLASPPPHLLPLSTAAFAAASIMTQPSPPPPLPSPPPPARPSRSTIDDIIDSVARGEDLEDVADDGSDDGDRSRPEVAVTGLKVLESHKGERKKHKKKKSKTRSKPPPRSQVDFGDAATAVDSEQSNDHRRSRTGRAASEAAAALTASAVSPALRADSPAAADDQQAPPEPEYRDHADDEMAVDEPAVVDVVEEDIEVVHEVEVEIDEPQGELPGRDAADSGSPSAAAGLPSPSENFSVPSIEEYNLATTTLHVDLGDAERQQQPPSPQQTSPQQTSPQQEAVGLLVASNVEKRKEKHKKEKKEKKKKKNKDRHREKQGDDDDGGDTASRSSASKKLHKEHHRHKHHHSRGEGGSGKSGDDGEKKREHSSEHRHRTKDKSALAGTGDAAEPRHQAPLEAAPAVTTASVPKLLFKIAGKTISTVSSGDDSAGGPSAVSVSSGKQLSSPAPQVAAAPRTAPPRTKATEIYTETEFTGGTTETVDVVQEEEDNKVWICPTCQLPDDGTPMIGCDKCEEWYHWICVGVETAPPEDVKWFCPRCRPKKPPKKKAKH